MFGVHHGDKLTGGLSGIIVLPSAGHLGAEAQGEGTKLNPRLCSRWDSTKEIQREQSGSWLMV